jgi:Mn-dependent DtxR family transcriptional regulator
METEGPLDMAEFTYKQGQYLAFIHLYRKLHRQGPAEADMVQYFCVSPPSVHQMIVKLEQMGLITRESGVPRSTDSPLLLGG